MPNIRSGLGLGADLLNSLKFNAGRAGEFLKNLPIDHPIATSGVLGGAAGVGAGALAGVSEDESKDEPGTKVPAAIAGGALGAKQGVLSAGGAQGLAEEAAYDAGKLRFAPDKLGRVWPVTTEDVYRGIQSKALKGGLLGAGVGFGVGGGLGLLSRLKPFTESRKELYHMTKEKKGSAMTPEQQAQPSNGSTGSTQPNEEEQSSAPTVGALAGAAGGATLGNKFFGPAGALVGGGLGALGGGALSQAIMQVLQQRKSQAEQAAMGKPEMVKTANVLETLRKARKGVLELAGAEWAPDHVTMPINKSGTIPTTKPYVEKNLLPDSRIQPMVGVGKGGLQMRLRIDRKPDSVPTDSIVGQGLANQLAAGSGAEVSYKPKTASPLLGAALGTAAGGTLGALAGPEEGRLRRALVGGAVGGVAGTGLGAGAKLVLDDVARSRAAHSAREAFGGQVDDLASKVEKHRANIDRVWEELMQPVPRYVHPQKTVLACDKSKTAGPLLSAMGSAARPLLAGGLGGGVAGGLGGALSAPSGERMDHAGKGALKGALWGVGAAGLGQIAGVPGTLKQYAALGAAPGAVTGVAEGLTGRLKAMRDVHTSARPDPLSDEVRRRTELLHREFAERTNALATQYQMDPGYVASLEDPDYPDALEHNVAFESAMQKAEGGPGVDWDEKKWGKPHPELGSKPKTAAPVDALLAKLTPENIRRFGPMVGGGLLGGMAGHATGEEGQDKTLRTLVGGALGAAGGEHLRKYLDANQSLGQRVGTKVDDIINKVRSFGGG